MTAEVQEDLPADEKAEVTRLAALGLLAYERQRRAAAKKLNIRVPTLDKIVEAARRMRRWQH